MTPRKTLVMRSPGEAPAAPAIKKKGRGWEISAKRLDALHARARDMRRHSTPAHKALADRFAKADLGRYAFTRHAVVGSAILDFVCHNLGMAIAIDDDETNAALARRADARLEAVGIRVMRVRDADVLANIDEVLARITAGMRLRLADRGAARRRHLATNPNQTSPRRPAAKPAHKRPSGTSHARD